MSSSNKVIAAIAARRAKSLTSLVFDEIERMILSGEIPAGERLNEQWLAGRLGVSRGPVREARRALENAGLVVAIANKGVYVRKLARDEMAENYDIRALVTGFQCAAVASKATAIQKRALADLIERMDRAIEASDSTLYYHLNIEFHARLAEFADHGRARSLYDELAKQSYLGRQLVLSPRVSNDEHKAIFVAIEVGDVGRARELGESHVLAGKARWFGKSTS